MGRGEGDDVRYPPIFFAGDYYVLVEKRFAILSKQRLLEFSSPGVCHAVVPGTLLLGKFHKNAQLGITIIEHINKKVNKL